jgi:hypothetical protein
MTMRCAAVVAVAAAACAAACGGRESAPAPPPTALASWSYVGVDGPVPGGTSVLADQCLSPPLPLGSDGQPDCVFIRATYPHGSAAPADVAACLQCNAPGEAQVPATVPLASVGTGLEAYDCLCLVEAQSTNTPCPPPGGFSSASPAAWCYAPSEPSCAGQGATSAIEYSPAASEGSVLFGACFSPGTIAVTYAP